MQSLFAITEEFLGIMSKIEELEGEITPELEEALRINKSDLDVKCANYYGIIKHYDGQLAVIKSELERLGELQEAITNRQKRLKFNLLSAVLLYGEENPKTGVKTLDFGVFKLSTRRNPKIDITDEASIDTKYCDFSITAKKLNRDQQDYLKMILESDDKLNGAETKADFTISKTRIKADIEAGVEVEGAKLDNENYSLTIK